MWQPRPRKANVTYFLSYEDVSVESSDMCVSFGNPTGVRKRLRGYGGGYWGIECTNMKG